MEKEKIMEVALEKYKDSEFRSPNAYCFIEGAEWLQSRPLAERLTDDEKAKIRALYNGETFGELDFIELVSTRRIFKVLFGPELFEGEDKYEEEN